MKIVSLVGARPQFIKEALVGAAVRERAAWRHVLVHSGQHYDADMSDVFFQELDIPQPDYHLGVGSGSHARMTAAVLTGMEDILLEEKPDALLVYGDTNTTLAGALAAAKRCIPVIHVEAGVRMLPRTMPEEINRVVTDRLSAVMCCCSDLGRRNLAAEGLTAGVHVTGDVMYDLFLRMRPRFTPEEACAKSGLQAESFVLATLHRNYNVDTSVSLRGMLEGLAAVREAYGLTILLPLHPRTRKRIQEFGLTPLLEQLRSSAPLGYLETMSLTCASRFVISDSGGLQKEAYYAGKRCAVMMPDTGWRELTDCGWNILCAPERESILMAVDRIMATIPYPQAVYGNGTAAQKIVDSVLTFFPDRA